MIDDIGRIHVYINYNYKAKPNIRLSYIDLSSDASTIDYFVLLDDALILV